MAKTIANQVAKLFQLIMEPISIIKVINRCLTKKEGAIEASCDFIKGLANSLR